MANVVFLLQTFVGPQLISSNLQAKRLSGAKEEISYLQKLRHPRLVSFLGFARDAGQVASNRISQDG